MKKKQSFKVLLLPGIFALMMINVLHSSVNALPEDEISYGERALHFAAYYGMDEFIAFAVKEGIDVNTKDVNGKTALFFAAEMGRMKTCLLLLKLGAEQNHKDTDGYTILDHALYNGYMDLAKWLYIDRKTQVSAQYGENYKTELSDFKAGKSVPNTGRYTESADPPIPYEDSDASNALLFAAMRGNPQIMTHLLNEKFPPDLPDTDGTTPLMAAIEKGNMNIAALLIQRGADINSTDGGQVSVLDHAIENGRISMLSLLKNKGARQKKKYNWYGSALLRFADNNFSNIESTDPLTGQTALMHAAASGHIEVTETLLRNKADINKKMHSPQTALNHRYTALLYAAENRNMECVKLLIKKGADLNTSNGQGMTALMYAVDNEDIDMVKLIVESGANINIGDSTGFTPYYHARRNRQNKVIEKYLESKGAVEFLRQ